MAVSKNVTITFPAIDWEQMRAQKAALLRVEGEEIHMEGVISMYDHIQYEAETKGCPVLWLEENTDAVS